MESGSPLLITPGTIPAKHAGKYWSLLKNQVNVEICTTPAWPGIFWDGVGRGARLIARGNVGADLLPGDERALERLAGRVHL